jgi:hypothetical protein
MFKGYLYLPFIALCYCDLLNIITLVLLCSQQIRGSQAVFIEPFRVIVPLQEITVCAVFLHRILRCVSGWLKFIHYCIWNGNTRGVLKR